jgi:hypothetical protein
MMQTKRNSGGTNIDGQIDGIVSDCLANLFDNPIGTYANKLIDGACIDKKKITYQGYQSRELQSA